MTTSSISTISTPLPDMASRALRARLISTCWICRGSALMPAVDHPAAQDEVDPLGQQPAQHGLDPSTTSAGSITCGRRICLREKASSCRVSCAARCAAASMAVDLLQRLRGRVAFAQAGAGGQDHGEQVVEVVGDAAGQAAH